MAQITFVSLTEDSENMDRLEELFEVSFPPEERYLTLRDYLTFASAKEIFADGRSVGFFVYLEAEEYVYLLFVAIQPSERGKGYGSLAIKSIIDDLNGKVLIGMIEKPMESAPNNTQRLRRKALYERLGFCILDTDFEHNNTAYLFIASECSPDLDRYFQNTIAAFSLMKETAE